MYNVPYKTTLMSEKLFNIDFVNGACLHLNTNGQYVYWVERGVVEGVNIRASITFHLRVNFI